MAIAAASPTSAENSVSLHQVAGHIRERIALGELAPGDRLPTRSELKQIYRTTGVTVQRAFDLLTDQGFVTCVDRVGSFVAPYPPSSNRYALVFPHEPPEATPLRFWKAVSAEAERIEATSPRQIRRYAHVGSNPVGPQCQQLVADMRTHQLAGVIFTFNPELVAHTAVLRVLDVPMVAIMHDQNGFGIPNVSIDYDSFFDAALDHMARRKRRRVAALATGPLFLSHREHFFAGLATRGLESRPQWWLPIDLAGPQWAASYVDLLMDLPSDKRPDGLIIADDNMTQFVLQGLTAAGIRVPEDLEVVAHGNFPADLSSLEREVPVRRLGYSVPAMLETCLRLLDDQRANKHVAQLTTIEACFEAELAATDAEKHLN